MIKRLTIITLIAVILVTYAYSSKFYLPTLPIESVSKKEVLQSINKASDPIVKIANEDEHDWFITRADQGEYRETIKEMIGDQGWEFVTQDGSGYFFEKGDEKLIVTTKMWTGKYVMVKVPQDWEE
jgi:predicted RNA binding protein YcfA (HicA-like mRNA interferase family)